MAQKVDLKLFQGTTVDTAIATKNQEMVVGFDVGENRVPQVKE